MAARAHSELAAALLRDAGGFFLKLGEDNADVAEQMRENARVFEQVAELVVADPRGTIEDVNAPVAEGDESPAAHTHAALAGRLLKDAAGFFRQLAEGNPSLAEQMRENAEVFLQVAALVVTDPDGELEGGDDG